MMRIRLIPLVISLAAACLLCACKTASEKSARELCLMTYNVGAFSKYKTSSLPEIASLILESGAALVSLNELDSCNRRHDSFQLKELADSLGAWDHHFAQAFPFAGGAYGNGIVSRNPILKRWVLHLPKGEGSEPRCVAVVETAECIFASVHLEYSSERANLEQIAVLNSWFQSNFAGSAKPVLLCGDMNARPESASIKALQGSWNQLSGTDFTYSTDSPHACIDYVFSFKDAAAVSPVSCQVVTAGTRDLSDHFPVLLRLKY